MKKRFGMVVILLALGLLATWTAAYGGKSRTLRGKTKPGDKFIVEMTNEGAKTRFLLTFTNMSEKMYAFFQKVTKDPYIELTLHFLTGEDMPVAKADCPVADFKFGAGGGLKYKGIIPCEQGCPSVKKVEVTYNV